jgi:hypothetical protein
MIPKPGKSPNDPKSYRPISLLNITGKIFERILTNRLNFLLESHNLLPPEQFGFRARRSTHNPIVEPQYNYHPVKTIRATLSPNFLCACSYLGGIIVLSKLISPSQRGFMRGRSTTTNLFCATQLISDSIDQDFQTDVVYLDFSKAFDSLDHNILVQKLQFVGASPMLVKFFCSYLQGRKQYVHCYGYDSASINVTSGVLQGSVLGPLLFLVFINDIGDKLTVPFFLFADDAKLLKQISEWSDCVTGKLERNNELVYKKQAQSQHQQISSDVFFFEKGKYQIRLHLKFESLEQA